MNRGIAFIPLLVLAALVGVSVFMLTRGGERENFTAGMVGRYAPAYELPLLGGDDDAVTRATFGDRAYLINLFASWCAGCRVEHAELMRLEAAGVPILGVAYKDDPVDTQAFLFELGDPFQVVGVDRQGRLGLELGVTGAPETYVVGPDGVIRAVHRGPLTPEIIEQVIMPALNAP